VSDIHLSLELLVAAHRGEVPPEAISRIALQHLFSLCPPCREEMRLFRRWLEEGQAGEYARALLVPVLIEQHGPQMEKEQRQARRDLDALLALSPETRIAKVKRAHTRFRGSELARLLVSESEKQVQADPAAAYHLADLARLVLNYSPNSQADFAPLSLALAAMANARRASGEIREAEARFGHVRDLIRKWGVTAPEVNARVDELEGSLRKDQRRFDEAEELLSRAEILYRLAGEEVGAVRVSLLLGTSYYAQGRPEEAIQVVRTALHRWPAGASPRLYLCARYNLACYLAEAGHADEAAELLDEDEELYRKFPDPWTQIRVVWLQGDLALARGDEEGATKAYREACTGFIEQGIGYDAALVALTLASIYLRQGRTAEVKRLAEEMIPIFQAQDVHREALAALRLFQEAARREEVTTEQVRKLVKYLQEARNDPGRRFE
jgi:tetratricopeptide (TPR) repeat protein